jgi:glycine oxidase
MQQHQTANRSEVVVVGGGVMGCSIAWRLAQRGASVTVIERGIPGAEASSAAAGMVAAQMEADAPNAGLELGLRSRALYPGVALELRELTGIDIGYEKCGILSVALDEAEERALPAKLAWQLARGLRVERLEGDSLRSLEPSLGPGVRAGLHFPDDAQVNPRELARALSQAAAASGARFLQGRYVRRVRVAHGRVEGVELDGEFLPAQAVVVAAGSWSGLVEGSGVSAELVRPVRGQIVAIETRPPLFRRCVAVHGRGYLVPRRDGTVLAGSTMEAVGFRKEVTVGGLARILTLASTLVPALAQAPVTASWSNFRPMTEDQVPLMGRTDVDGLLLATGHHRNGILLTPVTAQAMADLVLTGRSAVDLQPFAPTRFARASSVAASAEQGSTSKPQ